MATTVEQEVAIGALPRGGAGRGPRREFDAMQGLIKHGGWAYLTMMGSRPQAVGYGLTDSPAGLAAFPLVHGGFGEWSFGSEPLGPAGPQDSTASESEGRMSASSRRERIPSFPNTLRKCHSIVRGLRNSRLPISGLDRPSRASLAICRSCFVR
jgi:hypothetical protein